MLRSEMEEQLDAVDVHFHGENECAVCAVNGVCAVNCGLETLEGDAYNESEDFTIEAEERVSEEDDKIDGEVVERGCCMENMDNCCGDNVRGIRTCAGCLKQCTCEVYRGCRGVNYKSWLKNTFNVENVKSKFPIVNWLPKYRQVQTLSINVLLPSTKR